jgi:O-antigen ligase
VTGQRTSSLVGPSILAVMLITIPLAISSESNHPGYYTKLVWLHAGLAALAALAYKDNLRLPRSPIALPALVLLLISVFSTTQAVNRVTSVEVLSHRLALLSTLFLFLAAVSKAQIGRLVTVIAITSGLTSLIGIAQYAGWFGLDLPSSGMPSSTFRYRNFAAAFTIAATPFVALEAYRVRHTALRLGFSFLLFLNITFLLVTRSRAAWAACALSLVVATLGLVWKLRQPSRAPLPDPKQSGLMITMAVVLALVFSVTVPHRMGGTGYDAHSVGKTTMSGAIASTFEPGADKDRFTMWRHTLEMIQSFPVGVGLGNWQYVYPSFDQGEVSWKGATPLRPHNDYLWIAAETGVVSLGLFIWLLVSVVVIAIRIAREESDHLSFICVLASTASLLAIATHSVFSFPLERIPVTFLGAIAISILAVSDPATPNRNLRITSTPELPGSS